MPDVVTNLDALTPQWLTAVLDSRFPGISVRAVRVQPLEAGHNYVGNLAYVELTDTDGADAPRTLIAKLVPEVPAARELGVAMGIYLRETLFYAGLAQSAPTQPPDCYGATYDLETGLAALLLEDLTHLEVGVQGTGYTPQRALSTVLQLADQHAAFWRGDTIADLPWLPIWNQPEMVGFVSQAYGQAWPACQAIFAAQLTSDDIATGNKLGAGLAELMNAIAAPPVTLLHGDARYDNLLFNRSNEAEPPRTVDWQFVARGRGIQDIAYFLTQSGDSAVAATYERDLVTAYHERLLAAGITDYPAEACWTDYRRFALYSLVYPIFATGLVDPSNEAQLSATAEILRRGFDAARRLDSARLLAT